MIRRIILSTSLIAIAILSMLNQELVELRIVKYFISDWFTAQVSYRILIFSIIFCGLSIAIGASGKVIKTITVICSGFVLLDSLLFLGGMNQFGALFIHAPYQTLSLVTIGLLVGSLFLFVKYNKENRNIKPWVYALLIVPTIGISFIRIVYIEDWTVKAENEKSITLDQANEILQANGLPVSKENLLLPFFSSSCPYCRVTAVKLSLSKENGKLPNTVIIFPDNKEYAIQFLKETHLTGTPFINLKKEQFIELAGVRWPTVFHITPQGSSQYIGGSFNNFVLSEVENE